MGKAVTETGEGSVNSVVCFLSFLNTGSAALPGTKVTWTYILMNLHIDQVTKVTWTYISILLRLFLKTEEKGTLPKTFYEATITLIQEPKTKMLPKKKITGQYLWWLETPKLSTKHQQTKSRNTLKRSYTETKLDSSQGHEDVST